MARRSEFEWENHKFEYENKGSTSLQVYILRRLKEHEEHVTTVKVMKANKQGVSDLLLCVNGKFVAIELKVGSNTPTIAQSEFLESVARTGGIVGVARTWGEIKQLLRRAGYDINERAPIG